MLRILLDGFLIAWTIVTVALLAVVIYRSQLTAHEDDQIFLGAAESGLAHEQQVLVAKIEGLNRPIAALLIASGALLVVVAGLWLYQGILAF